MQRALVAALCLFVGAGSASTIDTRIAKYDLCGRFEIFHINGILTERPDADRNLTEIRTKYGNAYNGHLIAYGLAYNQTRGPLVDLYQSALQVISGYVGATWDKFVSAVLNGVYSVGMDQTTAKAIAKTVADLAYLTKPSPYTDQDMADIMADITRQTAPGSRKVFVPHSQGNLYMNLAYDKLIATGTPAKSIGVVGMAVPYSSVRSGNTFVTSSNDLVIDATRLPTLNNILGPTLTIPYAPSVDKLGHNLRATYLANSTAVSQMNNGITSEFNGLKTTAAQPSTQWQQHATTNWTNCGPGSPYPSGCYNMKSQLMLTPFVSYYPPATVTTSGLDIVIKAPGTLADAVTLAATNASVCQSAAVAELKNYKLTGVYRAAATANCGPGAGDAWRAYSGDATVTTTISSDNSPYNGSAAALINPVCRN